MRAPTRGMVESVLPPFECRNDTAPVVREIERCIAGLGRVLENPTRQNLVWQLRTRARGLDRAPISARGLADMCRLSLQKVSAHLRVMERAGVVEKTTTGHPHEYRLTAHIPMLVDRISLFASDVLASRAEDGFVVIPFAPAGQAAGPLDQAARDRVVAALSRGLSHPLRVRLLRTMLRLDGEASPLQLAEELSEPLGTVAHHVQYLVTVGCLYLRRVVTVRGAQRHFYWFTEDLLAAPELLRAIIAQESAASQIASGLARPLGRRIVVALNSAAPLAAPELAARLGEPPRRVTNQVRRLNDLGCLQQDGPPLQHRGRLSPRYGLVGPMGQIARMLSSPTIPAGASADDEAGAPDPEAPAPRQSSS